MKNLQSLHLSMICGDIMVNVLVSVIVFVILFFAALTLGIVLILLYLSAVSKLFDLFYDKLGK